MSGGGIEKALGGQNEEEWREQRKTLQEPLKLHPLSSKEPHRSRMLEMREKCKGRDQEVGNILSSTFKYNDQLKLVMCEVPKVASTTWQILLLRLGGFKGNITKDLRKRWDYAKIPNKQFIQLKSQTEALARMATYTTFFLTRHPFERLVSAYFDKFSGRSTYEYYKKNVGRAIARAQAKAHLYGLHDSIFHDDLLEKEDFKKLDSKEKSEVIQYIHIMKTGEISFPQFVKYLIGYKKNNNVEKMDNHWLPQMQICRPCAFSYSYIIRFDNLTNESNKLLDYIQTQTTTETLPKGPRITFPGNNRPFVKHEETEKMLKQISDEDVEILREIYADDFSVLNHDPHLYRGH
ncbi:unnamed protein product [Clavelina lepadiformis]|uniref:Carbohydrate sulfotransferase n=1 Tax=Clavelina lepadiformis TaxID=159417 RepID=A0ABP0FNS9_CLALP